MAGSRGKSLTPVFEKIAPPSCCRRTRMVMRKILNPPRRRQLVKPPLGGRNVHPTPEAVKPHGVIESMDDHRYQQGSCKLI